jgi:purine-nucleoside phosphorylase
MTSDRASASVERAALPGPDDSFAAQVAARIRERTSLRPAVTVVTGSGLAAAARDLVVEAEFSFEALPGFPPPTVPGHAGRLVLGELAGIHVAAFLGRVHLYEGHGVGSTTLIPRVAAELGARAIVVTNAAGALAPSLRPGNLMLIQDHVNLLGVNPLQGWRYPGGMPAFVDLSAVYALGALELAEDVGRTEGIETSRGVYVALPGPSFETPAETEFLRRAGGHAVGMSTVPEAVAAAALGMEVAGVSCITNVAGTPGAHEDVLAMADRTAELLRVVLAGLVPAMAEPANG